MIFFSVFSSITCFLACFCCVSFFFASLLCRNYHAYITKSAAAALFFCLLLFCNIL